MTGLLQNLLRSEHPRFKCKGLPELFVIYPGVSCGYNQNGVFAGTPEGQGFGDPGRDDTDGGGSHIHGSAGGGELQYILLPFKGAEMFFYSGNRHS
ncbi:hypothetical protein D3C86_1954060 [compost metagenome]